MSIAAYPLNWPADWRRMPAHQRKDAKFGKSGSSGKQDLTIAQATQRVLIELQRMGIVATTR